jgi:hypothetical protein
MSAHRIIHRIDGSALAVAVHRNGGKRPYIVVNADTLRSPAEFCWLHSSNTPMSIRFARAEAAAVAVTGRSHVVA